MRRLIRAIVAGLVAVPLAVVAATSVATPAHAEDNGVGLTPALGWSSWSFIRSDPTAAKIEAQARAMKSSGLASVGYQYVNVDDFWYVCPGSQGPAVDQYGRWAIDTSKFPSQSTSTGSENGIQAVADYVHKLGLKFGLYVTPGISKQAVAQNTPIEGTSYTADQIAEPSTSENNYNCGGMVGIDYSKPGAQQFINSWADQFASWGVDYVKIDGVGSFDVPDVQAWSNGLRQTGRPIHLELSNSLNINDAATWKQYANGWRTGGDVECYCGTNGSSYPLTDWNNVSSRFDTVAAWQPYGGPGAFNDYDSLEVGNGSNDGLTYPERQSQLALWALASSPLILGTDLTNLDQSDLALLKNRSVIAVDQDSIDASRLVDNSTEQIFAKTEKNGDVVAGLFNTGSTPQVISTTAATLKATAAPDYKVSNLWTGKSTETTGTISAAVPAHGVALVRVTPTRNPAAAPPAATLNLTGLTSLTSGQPVTATETFTNHGPLPAPLVRLGLQVPSGWTVTATSPTSFLLVGSGKTVQATFKVTAPPPSGLFQTSTVTGTARFAWPGQPQSLSVPEQVTTSPPVQAPYQTYSSATDAPAAFGQSGAGVRHLRGGRGPVHRRRRLQHDLPEGRSGQHGHGQHRGVRPAEPDRLRQGRAAGPQRHHRLRPGARGSDLVRVPVRRHPAGVERQQRHLHRQRDPGQRHDPGQPAGLAAAGPERVQLQRLLLPGRQRLAGRGHGHRARPGRNPRCRNVRHLKLGRERGASDLR